MNYSVSYTLILIGGLAIGCGLVWTLYRYRPGHTLLLNLSLSLLGLFITLMAVELFFAFYAETDNYNFTLASKNWFQRYWAVNSWGYRDIEWTPEMVAGKRKIIILGDSFTAGYGIKEPQDRFANILARKLGNEYAVMIVAERGYETPHQIKHIVEYPYQPDILILQYYINDIQEAARAKETRLNVPKQYPWPPVRELVANSYALNFLYWRSVRLGPQNWNGPDYLAWIEQVYNTPDIWWLHQQELLTIYEGSRSENIELIVVIFPALNGLKRTYSLTEKVARLFEERGVPTLNVGDLVEGLPPEALVVSDLDAHASPLVHRLVAEQLYQIVVELEPGEQP